MIGEASKALKVGLILLGISVFLSGFLPPSLANVPILISLRQDPEDPYTLLITIVHENPSPEHYVYRLQFDIDAGSITCPGSSLGLETQEEEEFTIIHSCLTPCHLSDPSTIENRELKVRAKCTEHGWSGWSEVVEIIEFNPLVLVGVMVALAAVAIAAKRALRRHSTASSK